MKLLSSDPCFNKTGKLLWSLAWVSLHEA